MWALVLLVPPVGPVLAVLGQATDGGDAVPSWLYVVGAALGSFLLTVLSGKVVVPSWAYVQEKQRADKWEAEAMRLNEAIATKHVPALDSATHALKEQAEVSRLLLERTPKKPAR